MSPETGSCLVNLAASMDRILNVVAKLARGQKITDNDLAELSIAKNTAGAVKTVAMAPVAFKQEGVLTQEEIDR